MWGALAAIAGQQGSNWLDHMQQNYWDKKKEARNWDMQEKIMSRAHQYEVADLRAAGLNPILSATGGPGARPGPNLPSAPTAGRALDVASALKLKAETKEIQARTKLLEEQALTQGPTRAKTVRETQAIDASEQLNWDRSTLTAKQGKLVEEQMLNARETWSKIRAETAKILEEKGKIAAEKYLREREKDLYKVLESVFGDAASPTTAKGGGKMLELLFRTILQSLTKGK